MYWLQQGIGRPQQAHGVQSPDEYREAVKAFLLRHGLKPVLCERPERPVAYVSDGRWVVDCDCGNGCIASPEWGLALCFECGGAYHPPFPSDLADVEAVLLARPHPRDRHYFPEAELARARGIARAETVHDLRRENQAHGIGG